jgi:hypothetical protein
MLAVSFLHTSNAKGPELFPPCTDMRANSKLQHQIPYSSIIIKLLNHVQIKIKLMRNISALSKSPRSSACSR